MAVTNINHVHNPFSWDIWKDYPNNSNFLTCSCGIKFHWKQIDQLRKEIVMTDITKQVLHGVIDAASATTESALNVLEKSGELAKGMMVAPVEVAGDTFASALEEARELQAKLVAVLRAAADAVGEPLP